jgi:hypothetical protein
MGKDVKGRDRCQIYKDFHSQSRESEEFIREMVSGEILYKYRTCDSVHSRNSNEQSIANEVVSAYKRYAMKARQNRLMWGTVCQGNNRANNIKQFLIIS